MKEDLPFTPKPYTQLVKERVAYSEGAQSVEQGVASLLIELDDDPVVQEERGKLDVFVTGEYDTHDLELYRDTRLVAIAEVKGVRNARSHELPRKILEVGKVERLLEAARARGVHAAIFLCFSDGEVFHIDATKVPDYGPPVMSGRKDRRDPRDWKPCYKVPVRDFCRVGR